MYEHNLIYVNLDDLINVKEDFDLKNVKGKFNEKTIVPIKKRFVPKMQTIPNMKLLRRII